MITQLCFENKNVVLYYPVLCFYNSVQLMCLNLLDLIFDCDLVFLQDIVAADHTEYLIVKT